jgi:hypothetical protein
MICDLCKSGVEKFWHLTGRRPAACMNMQRCLSIRTFSYLFVRYDNHFITVLIISKNEKIF